MAIHGLRCSPWLLGLVMAVSGCQGVPLAPGNTSTSPDGAAATGGNASAPLFDPAVRQTSAVQPLPSLEESSKTKPAVVYLAGDDDEEETREPVKKESSGFDWEDLAPEKVFKDMQAALGYGPNKELAKQYRQEGLDLYKQKRFKEAAAKFSAAASRWPDSPLEEDALFMKAECLFFAEDYGKSHDTFGTLLKKYDNSRHLDKVVIREFSIARYWDQVHEQSPHWPVTPNFMDSTRPVFDTLGNARKAYETVALHDPTGPLADDALMALGNTYFIQDRYSEAADYYDRLRKEHPNSPHVIDAHLLFIKSKQMVYQGPLYDATPLKEAGEVAELALRQFGSELGDQRDKLIKIENDIRVEMANRDWAMAKFYERKRQYGAARYYYRQIMKDYPQEKIADAARQRMSEIEDYPDTPPDRFKFLTALFPDGQGD
ncbi:MAG: outer membrane protein assembly factor BamD [Pirellulales bacterium]|nr:outer membrane protein assembly factor BamD [Pirellulales bacterium]